MKRWLIFLGAGLLLLAIGYGLGRYAQPAKVVTKTHETVRTEVQVQWKTRTVTEFQTKYIRAKAQVIDRIVTVYAEPDGGVKTVTQEHIATQEDTHAQEQKAQTETKAATEVAKAETVRDTSKETTYKRPGWLLGASARFGLHQAPVYGGEASRRVLGPLLLGVGVDTGPGLSVRAGLEF